MNICWMYQDISTCGDVIAVTLAPHGWGIWTSYQIDETLKCDLRMHGGILIIGSNLKSHLKRFLVTNCYFRILALILHQVKVPLGFTFSFDIYTTKHHKIKYPRKKNLIFFKYSIFFRFIWNEASNWANACFVCNWAEQFITYCSIYLVISARKEELTAMFVPTKLMCLLGFLGLGVSLKF